MTTSAPLPVPGGYRYEALDGLRGVCALCVCLFHFRANGPVASAEFVRGSWLFVDFFFVLAGFVIAASYRERLIAGQFMRGFVILRFGRVYPLHLFMLLAFIAMELVGLVLAARGLMQRQAFDDQHSIFAIFTNLTLTQAFGLHDRLTWNQPSWSIAVEFWTYVAFAFIAWWAGAALERWLVVIAIACTAILSVATPHGINVTHGWSFFRCLYGFAIGARVWRLWSRLGVDPGRRRGATVLELAAVGAVVGFVVLLADHRANLASPIVFGAVVLVFAAEAGVVSRVLVTAPLRRLGLLSYSIYMIHVFVQSRMDDGLRLVERFSDVPLTATLVIGRGAPVSVVGATPSAGIAFTLLMLAVVILVSQATMQFVEQPGRALSQRLAHPPRR